MIKFLGIIFLVSVGYISGQTVVRRVFLKDIRGYMTNVIQEVVNTVEQRGWSSLRLPDLKYELDSTLIFDRNYTGTVTYKNGFLVSIQHLDILRSSYLQNWNVTDGEVRVHVKGQLRMTAVTIGYDIESNLADGFHHYTGQVTLPLVFYDFWVVKTPTTNKITTKVFGDVLGSFRDNVIDILPRNTRSDDLAAMFNVADTHDGLRSWREVLHTIFDDVITRIPFPEMCYNCALPLL